MTLPDDSNGKEQDGDQLPSVPDPGDALPWDDFPWVDDAEDFLPEKEEDKRASVLVKWESGARALNGISRHVTAVAVRLLLAGTAVTLVVKPDLIPWIQGVLDLVLPDALSSGYGLTVPVIVAAALFRRELTRLIRRSKE
ncbi:MAG: hypothetical protein OXI76_15460 [Gemmatimonadota bacterium]|nr:hypothetical protein [Gemmatimonadota bacterium]